MNRPMPRQGGGGPLIAMALVAAIAFAGVGRPATSGAAEAAPAGWASALPADGQRWAAPIEAAAAAHELDPRLLAALVWQESAFNPNAISDAGAIGLAQLMPRTAADLRVDPYDPAANLEGGARYLRAQLDRFGDVDLALAAYNAGPGEVDAAGGVPPIAQTRDYVVGVTSYYDRLQQGSAR